MSYAIFSPIYGVPLKSTRGKSNLSDELKDMVESEAAGIIAKYSGSGDMPLAFGVDLDADFDECTHHLELSKLKLTASLDQVKKFDDLFAGLTQELKDEILTYGPPRVFILVSSS
jgi:hypothetical protein